MLAERLEDVRQRIRQACQRSGRDPSSVTLVCVTKGIAAELIHEAVQLGLTDFGENRVQEARQKQMALGSRLKAEGQSLQPRASSLQPIRWHLIGHLQRNKVRHAVELFETIHSLDSVALAQELQKVAATRARPIEVFIQVNVSCEPTKFGCHPDEAVALARTVLQLPHLRLKGLMTLAPFADDPEHARPHFRRLRELRDELLTAFSLEPSALSLSMGMSQDFEVAIEEGADIVRIGTAIFGDRRPETGDQRQETGDKGKRGSDV